MRNPLPVLVLLGCCAGLGAAAAQPAPPPAPPPGQEGPAAPGMRPPPPPPPGSHVILDRGPNGVVHVDVKCPERDSAQDCAGIAAQMLEKLGR